MFTITAKEKTFYFSLLLAVFLCIAGLVRNSTSANMIQKGKISYGADEQVDKAGFGAPKRKKTRLGNPFPRSGVPGTSGGTPISSSSVEDVWDPAKYISVDEIQPGMEAYCLTCYEGTKIEKFELDVISVVRNIEPGRDAILVKGTDERFIRTGPVWGCSGSPVYIDGRLAGALAFAWTFSKDPLYGVTPIEEMLRVGQSNRSSQAVNGDKRPAISDRQKATMGYAFDFTKPIDFAEIDKQLLPKKSKISPSSFQQLPCPLLVSGLSAKACQQLAPLFEPFGLMVVPGIGGGGELKTNAQDVPGAPPTPKNAFAGPKLEPGAVLSVPLVSGDITMFVLGTATEIRGDKVYGFGHSFLGYGPIDLPMATGQVHTVVSSLARSYKLGSALEIVGVLTTDESTAVFGQIGAQPKMIPLFIKVDRYNDTEPRVYNCQVAHNRLLTPGLLRAAMYGAAFHLGDFPPDHMIEYKVAIGIEGGETISFKNVSTGLGVAEAAAESISSIALLMNNPYKEVDIKSVDFDIRIAPKNIVSHIWSVDLSDSKVKAGQEIKIAVVVESFLAEKKEYYFSLRIPEQLKPGKYTLTVCGSYDYERFLRKAVPYRFMALDMTSLIKALNDALSIERDRLYCLLSLPAGGVAVERAELPDLPATKTLLLQNTKRALRTQPYPHWLEKSMSTGTIVADKKTMRITVEK